MVGFDLGNIAARVMDDRSVGRDMAAVGKVDIVSPALPSGKAVIVVGSGITPAFFIGNTRQRIDRRIVFRERGRIRPAAITTPFSWIFLGSFLDITSPPFGNSMAGFLGNMQGS